MFNGIGLRASCAMTAVRRAGAGILFVDRSLLEGKDEFAYAFVATRRFSEAFPHRVPASAAFYRAIDSLSERSFAVGPHPIRHAHYIDVLTAMGFEECSTGGGCTGLEFTRPDGEQCLITHDAQAPKHGEGWMVGFYNDDGEQTSWQWFEVWQLLDALVVIAAWRVG